MRSTDSHDERRVARKKVRQCPLDDPLNVQRACERVTITPCRWSNGCLMDDANRIYTNNGSIDPTNALFTFIASYFYCKKKD